MEWDWEYGVLYFVVFLYLVGVFVQAWAKVLIG